MSIEQVRSENFRELVLESHVPVVVDFYADWCHPCHALAPEIEALAEKWSGKVRFVKLDVDELAPLAGAYGVSSIPTVMAFKDARSRASSIGVKSAPDLERELGLAALVEEAA
ncbi:MAG: thioredoxin [Actinobacteria bacterium]|nr:thioredoxin [Actinomycetota bacterium]